jgi:hypothetical protein
MLSTPHKRFVWAKSDRLPDFSFFRTLLMRRSPPPPPRRKMVKSTVAAAGKKWKPAPWTPWLWIK